LLLAVMVIEFDAEMIALLFTAQPVQLDPVPDVMPSVAVREPPMLKVSLIFTPLLLLDVLAVVQVAKTALPLAVRTPLMYTPEELPVPPPDVQVPKKILPLVVTAALMKTPLLAVPAELPIQLVKLRVPEVPVVQLSWTKTPCSPVPVAVEDPLMVILPVLDLIGVVADKKIPWLLLPAP
jgi:hypothetical protein